MDDILNCGAQAQPAFLQEYVSAIALALWLQLTDVRAVFPDLHGDINAICGLHVLILQLCNIRRDYL